jgi:hypothetical protein
MSFVTIPAATYELGWRFSDRLPERAADGLSGFLRLTGPMPWSSKRRKVALAEFKIAAEAVSIAELIGNPYDLDDNVSTIEGLGNLVDERLAVNGLRLPSEDEFEAACGGSLFAWGMTIPDGVPYGSRTSFEDHRKPNAYGLTLNSNPYRTELVRCALKLGDGGCSICGGYPWPVAWFALSPCFHLLDEDIEDCFCETLEETFIRPIKR